MVNGDIFVVCTLYLDDEKFGLKGSRLLVVLVYGLGDDRSYSLLPLLVDLVENVDDEPAESYI